MTAAPQDSIVLFAEPIRAWTVTDDGVDTLTVPIEPEYQGAIAEAVADPDLNVTLGIVVSRRTPRPEPAPEPAPEPDAADDLLHEHTWDG